MEETKEDKRLSQLKSSRGIVHKMYLYTQTNRRPPFEVLQDVENQVEIDFNFMCNLYGAAVIAAVGLGTNSPVMVTASMLISPLMGPILGSIFGFTVRKWDLMLRGFINEIWAVIHTIFGGFLMGLILSPLAAKGLNWPTDEMSGRGTLRNFVAGLFFALASGVILGVDVSAANGNALVGVAISASLLPPLVNTGMCLAFAAISSGLYPIGDKTDVSGVENDPTRIFHLVADNENHAVEGWPIEYQVDIMLQLEIAGWSFALYMMNYVVIFLVTWIVFKLKRYGPENNLAERHNSWKSASLINLYTAGSLANLGVKA
uniref:DUF389 domain-containing protein n=1 Tax=Norrisiella sphaerica TaxID=552664 RepID=A0A7S2QT20_9EUKA